GRGVAGRAVRERTAITVDDMTQDPRILLRNEALERGFRSLVMLPLMIAEESVGVLALYAGEVAFFDEEEMKLLRELAGDIAFALEHMQKEDRVGDEAPEGHGISAVAVREMRALVVRDPQSDPRIRHKKGLDERGVRSAAILPLIVSARAVGSFGLHSEEAGFFDEEEIKV